MWHKILDHRRFEMLSTSGNGGAGKKILLHSLIYKVIEVNALFLYPRGQRRTVGKPPRDVF
jgi:hypothetical protein